MENTATIGQELNTALTSNISGESILSNFIDLLPWVAVMVGVAFLIYEARKMLKGASKGKVSV